MKHIPMDLVRIYKEDIENHDLESVDCPKHRIPYPTVGELNNPSITKGLGGGRITCSNDFNCRDWVKANNEHTKAKYTKFPPPWHFLCSFTEQALDDFSSLKQEWQMRLRQILYYDNGMYRYLTTYIINCSEIQCFGRLFCNSSDEPDSILQANEISRTEFDNRGFKCNNSAKQYLEEFTKSRISVEQMSEIVDWLCSRHVLSQVSLETAQKIVNPWKNATQQIVLEDWADAVNRECLTMISPNAENYLRKVNKYGPLHKKPVMLNSDNYPTPMNIDYMGGFLIPDFDTDPPPYSLLPDKEWTPVGKYLKCLAFVRDVDSNIHQITLNFDCETHKINVDTLTDHTWSYFQIGKDSKLKLILQLIEGGYIKEIGENYRESNEYHSFLSQYRSKVFANNPRRLDSYPSSVQSLIRPCAKELSNLTVKRW